MPDQNPVKTFSSWIDQVFAPISKPLGQAAGSFAGNVSDLVAPSYTPRVREATTKAFEGLPRGMVDTLAYAGSRNPLLRLAGAGDAFLHSYGQEGQTVPGALGQTAAFAAAPKLGEMGRSLAGMVAPKATQAISSPGAKFLAEEVARRTGSIAAENAPFELADALEAYRTGQKYDPFTVENVVGNAVGTLPFEAVTLPRTVREYREATRPLVTQSPMSDQADSYRVNWENEEGPRSRDFLSQESANMFSDELRKRGKAPVVEPTGVVERSWVQHNMAFKPDQLQEGMGLKMQELLNELPETMQGKQLIGTLKNKVPATEWELVPGFEEWASAKGKVTRAEADQWLRENRAEVKVRKAGQGSLPPETKAFMQFQHEWYDTLDQTQKINLDYMMEDMDRDLDFDTSYHTYINKVGESPKMPKEKVRKYIELFKASKSVPYNPNEANWAMVAPKEEAQMPGYVEIAVTRPPVMKKGWTETEKGAFREEATGRETFPIGDRANEDIQGIKFPSSHSFPPNTLGWSRGYLETLPDGKKAFHVIEVQSDWGAEVRQLEQKISKADPSYPPDSLMDQGLKRLQKLREQKNDPLLKKYESLVLKQTLLHALREGADYVAISDAETAMMTEGHHMQKPDPQYKVTIGGKEVIHRDGSSAQTTLEFPELKGKPWPKHPVIKLTGKVMVMAGNDYHPLVFEAVDTRTNAKDTWEMDAKSFGLDYNRELVSLEGWEPPQAAGMRLHYDKTLVKIMQELTGSKGEKVNFGLHKQADESAHDVFGGKQETTALSFPLARFKSELEKRGGLPMVSDKFLSTHVASMQREGYQPEQIATSVNNIRKLSALPGETPLQAIARSVGIDKRVFATMKPEDATESAFQFLTAMYHHNYGEPVERAVYLAKQTMLPLVRLSPWLKNTKLVMVPGLEGQAKFHGVKADPKDDFTYLIGVPDLHTSQLDARMSPEAKAFEVTRALGHEATHNAIHAALNPVGDVAPQHYRAALRALAQVESIPPSDRKEILQRMLSLVVPSSKRTEVSQVNFERSSASPEEFLADFSSIIALGSLDKSKLRGLKDALVFGDEAQKDFSSMVYRDLTSIWKGVKEWLGFVSEPEHAVSKTVNEIYDNLTSLMATRDESRRIVDGFHAYMDRLLSGPLDPPPVLPSRKMHALFSRIEGGLKETSESMQLVNQALAQTRPYEAPFAGERLTFFKDFFKPMAQLVETLKEKVPSVVPVFGLAVDYRGLSSQLQMDTWKTFVNDKGQTDWKRLRWIAKEGSPQNKAFNAIALVDNVRTQKEGAKEALSRAQREQLSTEYRNLSDEDKARVDLSLDQFNAMGKQLAHKKWNAFRDRVSWGMAKVIMSYDPKMYHDKAKEYADRAVFAVFGNDPAADAHIASIPIAEPAKLLLKEKIMENAKEWNKMGDRLLGPVNPETGLRPGKTFYLPEVRIGDWQIAYKLKGEDVPHHQAFKSSTEAARRLKAIQSDPNLEWVKPYNAKDRAERFRGMVQEDISAVQQDALDVLYKTTLSAISREHPEAQDIIDQIKKEVQPAAAFANIAVSPYMREREFIPGREDLNMVEGMVRYVDASAYNVAKGHVKQATVAALYNPDMRQNPNIRNEFQKYVNFVTDAEGKEFTMMKNLVFFNYLGFNPAAVLQEPVQQLVSLVPYLIENGMGIGQSYKAIRDVNLMMAKDTLPDTHKRALREAVEKRVVDEGFISDLYGEQDHDFASRLSSVIGRDGLGEKVDLLRKPLYHMLAVARKAYGFATAINSKAAFLASFDMAFKKHGDYDKAVQFATQATYATMFGGGKAARPMVLQRFGSMTGIGGLMYTLGSYSLNSIAMMGRLTRKAILDSTLTPPEKNAAMKAAGVMFTTQLALAGALGLPLVAPGLAILEQIFPGLDARKAVREAAVNIASFATDDEELGHTIADGALRGLGNLSPVDFGSRFQLANVMGVSPYDGFSWRNLAGPASSMLEGWLKAGGMATSGDVGGAIRTAAPTAARNVLNAIHDDWAVRDKAGRLIAEMTPAEKVLTPLGFKPKRLSNYYEEQRIRERTEDYNSKQMRSIKQEAAKWMVKGDLNKAREVILQGMDDVGQYDPQSVAREAALLAQDMQNPIVQRTTAKVNLEAEKELARLYPRSVGQTEVQRMLRSQALARGMGLGSRPNLGSLRHAALVDRLIAQNPRLTYPEARSLAERMERKRR